MGFTIPNEADAFHADQAEPDKVDFDIMAAGLATYGVVSGCAVTAQGTPDMTVAVAVGVLRADAETAAVAGGTVTIATADATNPRIDLILIDWNLDDVVVAGTPAANPVMPAYDVNTDGVVIAAVYVPANDTAIGSTQIIDKRVFLPAPVIALPRIAAGVPSGAPVAGENGMAIDTTGGTGGVYGWDGAAWVKGASI